MVNKMSSQSLAKVSIKLLLPRYYLVLSQAKDQNLSKLLWNTTIIFMRRNISTELYNQGVIIIVPYHM